MMSRIREILLFVAVISGSFVLPAAAEPASVSWSIPNVSATISRGGQSQTTVNLTATKAVGPLEIKAAPNSQLVRIAPSSTGVLRAGQMVAVQLTFSTPPGPASHLGVFTGSVSVTANGIVAAVPLPFRVTVAAGTGDSGGLIGSDGDGNGVWDYIDAYINSHTSSAKEKAAARQFAKAMQALLQTETDRDNAITALSQLDRSIECYHSVGRADYATQVEGLKSAILNNNVRSRTYIRTWDLTAGSIGTEASDDAQSCVP